MGLTQVEEQSKIKRYFFVKAKGSQPGMDRMLKLREPPAWICSGTLAERFSWTAKAWGRGHGLRIVCWILANLLFRMFSAFVFFLIECAARFVQDALRNLALDCQVYIICPMCVSSFYILERWHSVFFGCLKGGWHVRHLDTQKAKQKWLASSGPYK